MLKNHLSELSYKIEISSKCSIIEFEEFFECSIGKSYEANEKVDNIFEFCECFWLLCINLNIEESGEPDVKFGTNMLNTVEYLATLLAPMDKIKNDEAFYVEKGVALIKFLNCILNYDNKFIIDDFDFVAFYGKLNDVMDRLRWVFGLEVESKKIFPINRLLDRVVTDFKMDDSHYLQLIFSLQIFNSVGELSENRNIKDNMLEIAKKYKIAVIEMMCNGGKLLYGESAGINSIKNGTIVVVQGTNIVIRNIDQTYFDGRTDIKQEINDSVGADTVAYYIEDTIKPNYKMVSINEILKGENHYCKQVLLSEIFEKSYYNIFMEDMIFVNSNTNDFECFVNPYGKNDVAIVESKSDVIQSGDMFKDFLDILAKSKKGLRTCLIKENRLNVISLDFFIEFYRVMCQQPVASFIQNMMMYSEDDFYQNQLLKNYFDYFLENGEIKAAIERYNIFVENFINFLGVDENTNMSKMAHLIMPYKIYIPFEGDINILYEALLEKEYINNSNDYKLGKITVRRGIGNRKNYFINEKEIKYDDIIDLDGSITDQDLNLYTDVFYSDLHDEVINLTSLARVENILKQLKEQSEIALIEADKLVQFSNYESIICIINNIGMCEKVYSYFGCSWKDKGRKNICLYKFLWHIQIYQLLEDRYMKFEDLILNKYYCKFVLNPEGLIHKFVDKLQLDDEAEKLIIAKEVDGEGATLNYIIEKEFSGERGTLRMAFCSEKIASKVEMNENDRYEFLGKEIDEIVFITDNILSGGSTSRMLNYYINDLKEPWDKRIYLWLGNENIASKIIQKNKPKIELRTIFCTKQAKEELEEKWEQHSLHITSHDIIDDVEYKWTKEVDNIICELYGTAPNPKQSEFYRCVFRINNMPSEKILPDKIKNPLNLVGIFMRRDEV